MAVSVDRDVQRVELVNSFLKVTRVLICVCFCFHVICNVTRVVNYISKPPSSYSQNADASAPLSFPGWAPRSPLDSAGVGHSAPPRPAREGGGDNAGLISFPCFRPGRHTHIVLEYSGVSKTERGFRARTTGRSSKTRCFL